MKIVTAHDVPQRAINAADQSSRAGTINQQSLLDDDAPDGLNFIFVRNHHSGGDAAFRTPRHRHAFQQIRLAERGGLNYAPGQDIPEGHIGYFPRGTFYGPQLRGHDSITILLQFGFHGQHQKGKQWERYRPEALARLRERGTLGDGVFSEVDPITGEIRQRDGVQAIYEEQYRMHTNKEFVVEPEGYYAPITMRPTAFPYYQQRSGVGVRQLGRFYDQPGSNGDVRISIARLSNGGSYRLVAERAQVAWTLGAGLRIEGVSHPELTFLYSPLGEEVFLEAEEEAEVYIVDFPRCG